jgi:hypothetical protein
MPAKQIFCNHSKQPVSYSIIHGFDLPLTLQADHDWNLEKMRIVKQLFADHPDAQTDPSKLEKLFTDYNLTDWHWIWNCKAFDRMGKGYEWFYLVAENKVQGICIIFHPKESPLHSDNIFYVDYIAAAYWNRPRPNYKRQFDNLGTILLSYCVKYSVDQLKYRPGFFLHSLPTAEGYYSKKGLRDLGIDTQYEDLRIFEASESCSIKIMKEYADA